MKAIGIFNGRRNTYYRTYEQDMKQVKLIDPNPQAEMESLQEKLCKELSFIAKYRHNYKRLVLEALGRAKYYRARIKELKGKQS